MERFLKLSVFLSLLLLLSGCGGIFDPHGDIAAQQKNLIITTFGLMLLVVVPVFVLIIYVVWKYRASNSNAVYNPEWAENYKLELAWWIIPSIIILVLAVLAWRTSHSLDPYRPIESDKKPVKIQVVALSWKWLFIYPEYNIATVNYIKVPVDTPVNFELSSDAVMNSFWIPQIAGQVYVMAGMVTKLHVIGRDIGIYRGLSSNYSGDGFVEMEFDMDVGTQEEFESWVKKAKLSNRLLNNAEYLQLIEPSVINKQLIYSSVSDGLFKNMVMKYMSGMKNMEGVENDAVGAQLPNAFPVRYHYHDYQEYVSN